MKNSSIASKILGDALLIAIVLTTIMAVYLVVTDDGGNWINAIGNLLNFSFVFIILPLLLLYLNVLEYSKVLHEARPFRWSRLILEGSAVSIVLIMTSVALAFPSTHGEGELGLVLEIIFGLPAGITISILLSTIFSRLTKKKVPQELH